MVSDSPALSEPLNGGATAVAVVQRVADPAPLGLAAFAMTTFALSIGNTNVWGPGADAALALALVYGGGVQLLAGMWEFARKNTFGALAFSSYGAFWISYYVFVKFVAPGIERERRPRGGGRILARLDDLYFLHDAPVIAGKRGGGDGLRPADRNLRPAHGRGIPVEHGLDQGRRLGRTGHRRSGLVRLLRRSDERDVQEDDYPDLSTGPVIDPAVTTAT